MAMTRRQVYMVICWRCSKPLGSDMESCPHCGANMIYRRGTSISCVAICLGSLVGGGIGWAVGNINGVSIGAFVGYAITVLITTRWLRLNTTRNHIRILRCQGTPDHKIADLLALCGWNDTEIRSLLEKTH